MEPDEDISAAPFIYAFESQQSIVCDEVMQLSEGEIIIEDMTRFDELAVKFIIRNTTQAIRTIQLSIAFTNLDDELLDELLEHIRHVKFPELETLSLHWVIASTSTLQNVSKMLESCRDLRHLNLGLYANTNEGEVFSSVGV